MPGVAQLWLNQKELTALLMAGSSSARVNADLWATLEPRIRAARDSLGCPVPRRQIDGQMDVEEVITLAELAKQEEAVL